MRALAQARVLGTQVTGMADGTALEPTARDPGGGQVTRTGCREATRGPVHAIAGTVSGGPVCRWSDAATTMPWAVTVGQRHAHEARGARAWITPARMQVAGDARRPKVVLARGLGDGTTVWWLAQPGIPVVVPATPTLAVTADARAHAAAGEARPVGHRVHTGRHGHGHGARRERRDTAVVGITGLTTADPDERPEQGRQPPRRDWPPHPINAGVGRTWRGKDDGPGGQTGCRTQASVAKPLPPGDDDDERRRIEHGGRNEATPPGDRGHPPPKTARAVRIPGLCTLLLCALATASRLACERAARGGAPVGWQRWRHQLLEQTRDLGIVVAQGDDGIVQLAEYARLVGVQRHEVPAAIDSLQQVLVTSGLTARGSLLCWNFSPFLTKEASVAITIHSSYVCSSPPFRQRPPV